MELIRIKTYHNKRTLLYSTATNYGFEFSSADKPTYWSADQNTMVTSKCTHWDYFNNLLETKIKLEGVQVFLKQTFNVH